MTDVAMRLRSAREEAGLTIEELSSRTKIKPALLLALERGAYEQLPGEFFTRAFLRTYAQELRLPVAQIMADYEQAAAPVVTASALPVAPTTRQFHPVELDETRGAGRLWTVAALTIAVVIGVYALNRPGATLAPEPGAVGTAGTTTAANQAAASDAVTAPAADADGMIIDIKPTRPVWVTGTADGERVLFRQLEPGERITIEAKERLSFRVGDAGAFSFSLNGSTGRAVGRDGEVREFTITRDNLRSFQQ